MSLLAAVGGAAGCELALQLGPLTQSSWLRIVSGGFEAAVVGGVADWFAVTALFAHPLGIPFPHTAIIVTRREEITEGIVNLVQHELLSRERIDPWLESMQPSALVFRYLDDPGLVEQLEAPLRSLLRHVTQLLTRQEVETFLERTLHRQLDTLPIDASAGTWLARAADSEEASAAFETFARSLARLLEQPTTGLELHRRLDEAASTMRAQGRRVMPFLLRRRAVQRRLIDAACVYASSELSKAVADRAHPFRRYLLGAVKRFGERLAAGDAAALAQATRLRDALLESLEAGPLVREMLLRLQETLALDLDDPQSAVWRLIDRELRTGIRERLDDPQRRADFDRWIRGTARDLLAEHHDKIGPVVRKSLSERSNDELVGLIRDYVGADLQFIRLNGAVVGGLVGVGLGVLRWITG